MVSNLTLNKSNKKNISKMSSTTIPKRDTHSPADSGCASDEEDATGVMNIEIKGKKYLIDHETRELFDCEEFSNTGYAKHVGYWCPISDVVAEYSEEDEDITDTGYEAIKKELMMGIQGWQIARDEGKEKLFLERYFQIEMKESMPDDIDEYTIEDVVTVTDDCWKEFQEELAKYKTEKHKEKRFKAHLSDKKGEKARLIYKDGQIYEKASKRRVLCGSEVHKKITGSKIHTVFGLLTIVLNDGWFADKIREDQKSKIQDDFMNESISQSHTGNHYRNHTIKCGRGLYGIH